MKYLTHYQLKVSITLLVGFYTFMICRVDHCIAAPTIHEIPPLVGETSSKAYGINNAGLICGKSYTSDNDDIAMTWSLADGSIPLISLTGTSESSTWGINDSGQVSGFSRNGDGQKRAVRWDSADTIVDLGTFQNTTTAIYGDEGDSYNITDSGAVVGNADLPNDAGDFTAFHAFLHDGTTLHDLGTLNTTGAEYQYGYSIAYDANSSLEIVGVANDNVWNYRPFIHDTINGMRALPIDSQYSSGEWYAVSINETGMIGGTVIFGGTGESYAYYWENKDTPPVGLIMPEGFPYAEVYSVNNWGQMVGIMWSKDDEPVEHAFIFDKVFGVRDLNDLIDASSGWVLSFSRQINNNGQIVGTGTYNGNTRGFLLDSLRLDREGDLTNDGSVDLKDTITALKVLSGSSQLPVNIHADSNDDGVINFIEVFETLSKASDSSTEMQTSIPERKIQLTSNTFQRKQLTGGDRGITEIERKLGIRISDKKQSKLIKSDSK